MIEIEDAYTGRIAEVIEDRITYCDYDIEFIEEDDGWTEWNVGSKVVVLYFHDREYGDLRTNGVGAWDVGPVIDGDELKFAVLFVNATTEDRYYASISFADVEDIKESFYEVDYIVLQVDDTFSFGQPVDANIITKVEDGIEKLSPPV